MIEEVYDNYGVYLGNKIIDGSNLGTSYYFDDILVELDEMIRNPSGWTASDLALSNSTAATNSVVCNLYSSIFHKLKANKRYSFIPKHRISRIIIRSNGCLDTE